MPLLTKTVQVAVTDFEKKVEELRFPTRDQAVDFMRSELAHDIEFYADPEREVTRDLMLEVVDYYRAIVEGMK